MIESDMAEKLWSKLQRILLEKEKAFISVTGGGGKTSFLVSFSSYLKKMGYSVLITTSTKLASPYSFSYNTDYIFLTSSILNYWPHKGESVLYGTYDEERGKTVSPPESIVSRLYERYDVVIVEADGSRRLPLKKHTERDPVIWSNTTSIVAISGLWGYGKRISDVVFGDKGEEIVNREYLDYLIMTPEGLGKGMSNKTKNLFLFNGGDVVDGSVISSLKGIKLPKDAIGFVVSLNEDKIYESL